MRKSKNGEDVSIQVLNYRIDDACTVIGIGRTALYGMIGAGKLKAIKIAGRTLIPRSEIERVNAEAMANA